MGGLLNFDLAIVGTIAVLGGWAHVRFKIPLAKYLGYCLMLVALGLWLVVGWNCDREWTSLTLAVLRDGTASCRGETVTTSTLFTVGMTIFAGFTAMILVSAFAMGWRPQISTTDEDVKAPPPDPSPDLRAERQEAMAKRAYEAVIDLNDPEKLEIVADHYPHTFHGRLAAADARNLRRMEEQERLAREEQERLAREEQERQAREEQERVETIRKTYACTTKDGAPGVKFGGACWPLDTTKIEYEDIPYAVRREITDASPLADLTGLQTLFLSSTQVSDVTPLSGLTGLGMLDLTRTSVSDVTPLSGLTGLHFLRMRDGIQVGEGRDTPENRAAVAEAIRTGRPR